MGNIIKKTKKKELKQNKTGIAFLICLGIVVVLAIILLLVSYSDGGRLRRLNYIRYGHIGVPEISNYTYEKSRDFKWNKEKNLVFEKVIDKKIKGQDKDAIYLDNKLYVFVYKLPNTTTKEEYVSDLTKKGNPSVSKKNSQFYSHGKEVYKFVAMDSYSEIDCEDNNCGMKEYNYAYYLFINNYVYLFTVDLNDLNMNSKDKKEVPNLIEKKMDLIVKNIKIYGKFQKIKEYQY